MFSTRCHQYLTTIFLFAFLLLLQCECFTKVVVPSVYREWVNNPPSWATDVSIQNRYGFTTFLYQKIDPNKPNYLNFNRGTESGVYLKYIVDHYDNFPDVAIFVHAAPEHHQKLWLDAIGCISPTATYMNFNFVNVCSNTHNWNKFEIWVEQCWRDVLQVAWNITNLDEFHKLVPPQKPVSVCCVCCQQFILSREMVRKRSLSIWKKLLHMIAEQPVCRIGEPDYEHLYAYTLNQTKVGPEPASIPAAGEGPSKPGYGAHTQGGAMEYLAHVVFGHNPLIMKTPRPLDICKNFVSFRQCPNSPCRM